MTGNSTRGNVSTSEIAIGEPVTEDTKVWIDVGQKIIEDSLEVSRLYSEFMIKFSFGAIPIYVSLLALFCDRQALLISVTPWQVIVASSPILLFTLSSVLFIFSYYPKYVRIHTNIVEGIQSAYDELLRRRRRMNMVGTVCFICSVLTGVAALFVYRC